MALKVQSQVDQRQVQEVRKEVSLLKNLRHTNIVSFFEDFHYSKYICIVYVTFWGGNLVHSEGGSSGAHHSARAARGLEYERDLPGSTTEFIIRRAALQNGVLWRWHAT